MIAKSIANDALHQASLTAKRVDSMGLLRSLSFYLPAALLALFLALSLTLTIGGISGPLFAESLQSSESTPSELMIDNEGSLERVVLQYSSTFEDEILSTFMTLLKGLHRDISVTMVCESQKEARQIESLIRIWNIENPRRVEVKVIGKPITVWARDRFAIRAFRDNDGVDAIVLPSLEDDEDQDRVNDMEVPGFILGEKGVIPRSVKPGFFFEGGDMVSTAKRIFVGRSTLNRFPGEPEELMAQMNAEFGRPVVMLGGPGAEVLDCHIDLIFSAIDEKQVVLADPSLTQRLLDPASAHDLVDTIEIKESLEILRRRGISPSGTEPEAPMAYYIMAKQLRDLGYTVTSLPVIHCLDEDDEDFLITYCNVLLDYRDDGNYVYMPVYGLDRLDDYAESVFLNLGFHVNRVDISKLYQLGGTVRCVTNVLARKRLRPRLAPAETLRANAAAGG